MTGDEPMCVCEHSYLWHSNDGSDEWPCSIDGCYCTDFDLEVPTKPSRYPPLVPTEDQIARLRQSLTPAIWGPTT